MVTNNVLPSIEENINENKGNFVCAFPAVVRSSGDRISIHHTTIVPVEMISGVC